MDLKKKGFQLPEKIRFEEETLTDTYGMLIAEPLERGYGITLGNSLRRILLSSIDGAAATGVKIQGAVHEFATLEGVKEDVVDIILNIKELKFSMDGTGQKTAIVKATGPKEITGGDLQVDSSVKVLNPDKVLATLDKGADFEAEIYVELGKGFVPSEMNEDEGQAVDVISVDSSFSPVTKVNFNVDKARVGRSSDFDKLILEVWTDGSIPPMTAVSQAASIMMGHLKYFVLDSGQDLDEPDLYFSPSKDETVFNDNLLKNVDELELSVRAHNCLKNADIQTISDLVQKTEYEMLRTKNFGRKSLNEIKEILASMGLSFGMRVDMDALKEKRSELEDEA